MDISVKELRTQPGRILSLVKAGNDITITLRGKPQAKLIPFHESEAEADDFLIGFGAWKKSYDNDTDSVSIINAMREGRKV